MSRKNTASVPVAEKTSGESVSNVLERKRGLLCSKLARFTSFLNSLKSRSPDSSKLIELDTRMKDLESNLLTEYSEVQFELEGLDYEMYREEDDNSFECKYYEIVSSAKQYIFDISNPKPSTSNSMFQGENSSSNFHKSMNVKLPVIELPKFSGNYNNWLEFKELYVSLIHNNSNLYPVQKLHYLKASLEGSALQCIQSVNFTGENYELAWDILCERFDNKKLMIHNLIKSIFNIPELILDTPSALRNVIDLLSKCLKSLQMIGVNTESWDPLIIYIICTKLDQNTLAQWEQFEYEHELPIIEELKSFLRARADFLEKVNLHKPKSKVSPKIVKPNHSNKCLLNNIEAGEQVSGQLKGKAKEFSCFYCNKSHSIYKCQEFISLSLNEKNDKVKSLKLCTNCLRKGHDVSTCRFSSCRHCNEKHNSLLHPVSEVALVNHFGNSFTNNHTQEKSIVCDSVTSNQVLLATALVQVLDAAGNIHVCRALLDSASMSNFITLNLVSKLKLSQDSADILVSGVDGVCVKVSKTCNIKFQSLYSSFTADIKCLILPTITDSLPTVSLDPSIFNIPSYIKLADPTFHKSRDIDILIGAGLFWKLLSKGTKPLAPAGPILQNSKLGWLLSGPLNSHDESGNRVSSCHLSRDIDVQSQLQKFWELEELSLRSPWSEEEKMVEQHFQDTIYRNKDGRFVVSIPLKQSYSCLGESREGALRQFLSQEKRLSSNAERKLLCSEFMSEYENLGHMSPFPISDDNQITYYSPHHGVVREDSSTTKLRVVFNSSFPSSTGNSYNSIQLVGPTIQEDLVSILLRFRQHSYVISADICKMYRQIFVQEEFKPLQLILWRSNPEDELQTFSLNTVVYGTASAPFLTTRCLVQLAIENKKLFPHASEVIKRDFYVDDLLSGGNSISEVVELQQQVSSILSTAGFQLRKWKSNEPTILQHLNSKNLTNDKYFFGSSEASKVLGMFWSCKKDDLSFSFVLASNKRIVTKRLILSETAKIFDPLGLLGPVTVRAKVYLQMLWSLNLPWDQEVPQELSRKWTTFRDELPKLNNLLVARQATCKEMLSVEIHGFSDASQHAYGACIYLRTVDLNQVVHVQLLTSKSRVAPLKSISIPRLELCAALLLSQLYSKVKSCLTQEIKDVRMWSDSKVALAWIRSSPHLFQVFVGNRISEIQKHTPPEYWNYVPSGQNPADYLSRGSSPASFVENQSEWFCGPKWLYECSSWPVDNTITEQIQIEQLPEVRKTIFSFVQGEIPKTDLFPFNRFSSLTRIKHVMSYCLRFTNNCQRSKEKLCGSLTLPEIRQAELRLLKIAHQESFEDDIHHLSKEGHVKNSSKLLSLTPFLSEGIIRVGGRLKNSIYPFDKKHPILLCPKHHLTYLIFKSKHFEHFHCGPQLLLATVRESFWAISGKNLAKRIVRECVVCFKFRPKFIYPEMGNLPSFRVSPVTTIFSEVGVDYAGPFYYKTVQGRGGKILKCYLCLFVCLAVKAVHLELATDLSSQAFLKAFQRFISRRGKPRNVYSDNGSNFIGANNKLRELGQFLKSSKDVLLRQLGTELDIEWHFIAAYSPHQGGIWEAGIKSAKHLLLKVIETSPTTLTFEDNCTVISQIECLLNSRPLTQMSTDPNDVSALTPSHFLIGRVSNSLPYPELVETQTNRLDTYEKIEKLKQVFWNRWSREYLCELQQRQKWRKQLRNLSIGQLVLIQDNNAPPFKWLLGRISAVYPGADGVVRVASVQTKNGEFRRAVVKLAPLPIETN